MSMRASSQLWRTVYHCFQLEEYNSSSELDGRVIAIVTELGQWALSTNLVKKHGSRSTLRSPWPGQHTFVQTKLEEVSAWPKGEGAPTFSRNYNRGDVNSWHNSLIRHEHDTELAGFVKHKQVLVITIDPFNPFIIWVVLGLRVLNPFDPLIKLVVSTHLRHDRLWPI